MIIDSHIHLYDPAFGRFEWPPAGSEYDRRFMVSEFTAAAKNSKVDGAVLIGGSSEIELTGKLLESTRHSPEIVAVIGQIRADDPDFIMAHDRFSQETKFRGFRFPNQSARGPQTSRNIAYVEGKKANIIELLGHWRHTLPWAGLIAANPGVGFIIEHFGGYPFNLDKIPDDYRAFLERMASLPNTFIKMSGYMTLCKFSQIVPIPEELHFYYPIFDISYQIFGEQRCLFGSDWPVMGDGAAYDCCVRLMQQFCQTKTNTAALNIMGENAVRVYKIE